MTNLLSRQPPVLYRERSSGRDMTSGQTMAVADTDLGAAFERLYRERWPDVVDYARMRLAQSDAEDAAAEAFSRAWRGRRQFDPSLGTREMWLWGIVRHVVADRLRSSARGPVTGEFEPAHYAANDVAGEVARRLRLEAIVAAMETLPDVDREIIALRFGAGLTNRVIATLVDRSEGNVAVRLHRAVKTLRTLLEEDAGEIEPTARSGESDG